MDEKVQLFNFYKKKVHKILYQKISNNNNNKI